MSPELHQLSSRSAFRRFWEIVFRPDVLFTIAMIQGLSPYAFWEFGVGRAVPSEQLSYIPVLITIIGWASFVSGCFLVRRKVQSTPQFVISPKRKRIYTLIWILIGISIVEIILAVHVYGVLPIVSYIRGDNLIDVTTASTMQEKSAVGQIALLSITVITMAGLLLETAIAAIEMRKKVSLVFYCGLITALCVGLINGKRIMSVRLFAYLIFGLLLYSRNAVRNGLVVIPFAKKPIVAGLFMVLIVAGLFSMFGTMAVLRNQGRIEQSSTNEFVVYQEGPILNMEEQTRIADLGPRYFQLLPPLRQMIPIKWTASEGESDKSPPRIDESSPSGFYELIQWYWGFFGIVIFSGLVGILCMWLYSNIRNHAKYLLCYTNVAFSLLLAHSFNEFLILPFFLAPCTILWVIGLWTNTRIRIPQANIGHVLAK